MAWPGEAPDAVVLPLRTVGSDDTILTEITSPGSGELPERNGRHEDEATTSGATEDADVPGRVIFLNRPQPEKRINNQISSAKYNVFTFVPLFLFEQFRRYSNCFFLLIALLQQIPDVSPTGRWTTLTPLILILSVSAIKEIVEDWKRHNADHETNRRMVEVLQEGAWRPVQWQKLSVGDIVRVDNNQFFPADLVLLCSSEPQGMSFIETSNLDGETNLKVRQARPETAAHDQRTLHTLHATIHCEAPNRHLYEFNGSYKEQGAKAIPLGLDQMLLRGAMLRNTQWVCAAVVYTGHETKLLNNSTKAPLKRSTIDKQTNTQIIMLFVILLCLAVVSATGYEIWVLQHGGGDWYLGLSGTDHHNFGFNFLTFLILYNNLIPISLQVTAEIVRFFQAKFISMDVEMYHVASDTPAQARTSNLNEELGQVRYVFSDKTGTLTCNVMEFKTCSVAEIIYNSIEPTESLTESTIYQNLTRGHPTSSVLKEFLTMLAVCHTVIPEKVDGEIQYHAASPDERALVMGAAAYGYVFTNRTPKGVEIEVLGQKESYEVLNVIEFTSARKRMSVIVRTPEGKIKLFCKGADTVIYARLAGGSRADFADTTLAHLEQFATDGLRTLVFAAADISDQQYEAWSDIYHKASVAIHDREQKLEEAAVLIEDNLRLLGATAIEDKLQDGVPETIKALLKANIKVWVLTGDKQETAINIAHAASLLQHDTNLLILNESSLDATRESLAKQIAEFPILSGHGDTAMIVDGHTLKYAMGCDLRKDFLDLCLKCKVVVCCRVAPLQKADVVEMVSKATKEVTLAIGDGANDVAMIHKASVGVGISGVEGLQAVCASDYSIAQFRFLLRLLLVHGVWNYSRISKLILYSFYKNICLYVMGLWFALYNAWSGQILFERWTIGFYNVIFTCVPPFAIGLFDKICTPDTMMRHPILYIPSQRGLLFNVRVFWVWCVNSLVHSIIMFWMVLLIAREHVLWSNGRDGGYLLMGNIVYTCVVVTVCLKAGLATHSWTWVTHFAIWGSILAWLLFVVLYSYVFPLLGVGAVFRGMERLLYSSPPFWLALILVPAATLAPDLFLLAGYNTVYKSITEAVRESEIKKRNPDDLLNSRRPSLTETARLLQNVRSVFSRRPTGTAARPNDFELTHGFAFSQEEGGTVSQAEVIRAYDTSQPHRGRS